jgi:ribosomal protein S18 acetylase RimI-like enzyme
VGPLQPDRTGALARPELRPVEPGDYDFLYRVYASTRAEELAVVPWDEGAKDAFLRMQFSAQDRWYHEQMPDASYEVVVVDGEPAGRLYVDRRPEETRIVDIALLPEHRGRGVGTILLRTLIAEAAGSGRKLSIHVEVNNSARRLYARLGFEPVGEHGLYVLMERLPT